MAFRSRKVESSGQSWPTVSREASGFYGIRENGTYSDHVNIAGTAGDEIYAVADGVVLEAAFENSSGKLHVDGCGRWCYSQVWASEFLCHLLRSFCVFKI